MKSIRTTLIATALMAGLTGLAWAQTNPIGASNDSPRASHMEKMHAHDSAQHAQHLADLKAKLKLQTTQEPAWKSFTESMQHPERMAKPERAKLEKMTTPERLDHMQTMKATRDAQMQKRMEGTKTFYASLSAEQKQVFDQESARAMKGMHGMKGMKHGGQQSHHGQH
jgi:hypothetical protein